MPVQPVAQHAPQKPAQQFVIPSATKDDDDESSSEEEDAFDSSERPVKKKSKKPKKGAVPVMRRHGEPLMIMPKWQPLIEKNEHGHWLDEPQMEHGHRPRSEGDDERRIFEKEAANPFRGMDDEFHRRRQNSWLDEYERDFELDDYHHQYRYLETEPVNETN